MITKARKLILVNYYCLNDRLYLNFPMSLPSPNIHSRVSRCIVVSACVCAQSCPALCDPVDCSPPGSSVHGMFQARILESVPLPPSRGCFQHREGTCTSASPALAGGFFTTVPSGKPACLLSLLRSVVGNRTSITLLLTGQSF